MWSFSHCPQVRRLRARLGLMPVENWLLYSPAARRSAKARTSSSAGRRRRDRSVKFEYLYLDLSKTAIDTLDIDNFPFHVEYRLRSHFPRIGILFR
jgi:hypothetical protein